MCTELPYACFLSAAPAQAANITTCSKKELDISIRSSLAMVQGDEHTRPAVSEQELPSDQESSSIGFDKISPNRSKQMTWFVAVLLSMSLCTTVFSPTLTACKYLFLGLFLQSLDAWLWTLWWCDSKTLLKGIPAFVFWTLVAYTSDASDIIQKVLNSDNTIQKGMDFCLSVDDGFPIVSVSFLLSFIGYWLALFVGLVRILEDSATTLWTCLFTLTVVFARAMFLSLVDDYSDFTDREIREFIQRQTMIITIIFFVGGICFISKAAMPLYDKYLKPLTDNMKKFVVVDVVSMITFSYYSWLLTAPIAQVVSRVCLCIGWTLSIYFLYDFQRTMAIENQDERDKAFQRACKISVRIDVCGKLFTYACAVCGAKPHLPPWVAFLEFVTTLIEGMEKHSHASRAHAREAAGGARLTSYLLAIQEP